MNTITFKRKDIFTLVIENKAYFCLFSKFAPRANVVVFINSNDKKEIPSIPLKTLKDRYSPTIVDFEDTPPDFQKFYNETFFTLRKGDKASLEFEGNTIVGVVIKGGREIILDSTVNGKREMYKGPAKLFTLLED